jgi:hypothetical protein
MKRAKLPLAEVEHHLSGLQWGLLYYQDAIHLRPITDFGVAEIDNPKLLEAHLFDEAKAIHIFEYDSQLSAVWIEDGPEEKVDRKHELAKEFKPKGCAGYLWVRDYIAFDKDGMAYIEYSRPVKVE